MQITVGTTEAVRLPVPQDSTPLVQNLGPGKLYIDTDDSVTTTTGLEIDVDKALEMPSDLSSSGPLFLIADAADTDVRYLLVG